MKKLAKRIAALAMTAAMMTASAGAITQDGQSETWFDGVWALIDAFGLKAEHDPYVLQNYINKYLEKHPVSGFTCEWISVDECHDIGIFCGLGEWFHILYLDIHSRSLGDDAACGSCF